MAKVKAKVTHDSGIEFRCIHCLEKKVIPASLLKERKHNLKIKCTCKNYIELLVEGREKFRKDTHLDGLFASVDSDVEQFKIKDGSVVTGLRKINCHIRNLSTKGLGIRAIGAHHVRVGQRLKVVFLLDNTAKTVIEKMVVVKSVSDDHIGCAFVDGSEDAKLGFYVM